ncbi:signal transduction histidine kinase [Saccharothrix saharensis]|uniref:histidine kinase n=1 Tax=Saccharothrix saharensis TaxID=571190 RepID=A0A543JE07_9PSEU|nr:HAMP domain-containing sensor histidine kinase [Saccharothrix saharensis]TQM81004.1 signal transduction histidine kinase [Saccharothrix saharensis]
MSLRTVSLRRRVTLSAIGVLGVVLVGVVLLVDALFAAQSKRDVDTALLEKARVAQQLVKQQVRGADLVDRLEGRGVEVRLVMPDGTVFGHAPNEEVANEVSRQLVDGSTITVYAESSVITAAQARLRRLLLLAGIGALAVTVGAMVLVVGRALAPLDAMTTLARSIARGNRGSRLNPSRADNELGRTAAAFDDMLDSLEGSEERTKRFVADAAHELRTPIAGVQAVAEALMQTAGAGERERLNLLLVRESRRAGRLVDDLLALARIEAGLELHRERVDLLALAEAEVGRTQLLAPDFDIAVEGEAAFVSGDPQRLAQVLANLADNARQATGPSGRVRLRVSKAGGFALLVVSDNGPGVPPEDRERIFDRLVRLDEARDQRSGGSGLGLPIARGVVRAHGGELSCTAPDGTAEPAAVLSIPTARHGPVADLPDDRRPTRDTPGIDTPGTDTDGDRPSPADFGRRRCESTEAEQGPGPTRPDPVTGLPAGRTTATPRRAMGTERPASERVAGDAQDHRPTTDARAGDTRAGDTRAGDTGRPGVVARVGSGGGIDGEGVREAVGAVFEVRIPLAE